ncbi:ATP-dependent Zn protease [Streptacidiphilus sp. MAP5-52]
MAAEQVVYGVITTGAESDLEQVTNLARGTWPGAGA